MRKKFLVLTLALASALPVVQAQADLGPGGFHSANVSWVAHIPVDSPGVGGRVVQIGSQTRFYVTGVKGLTIYDVTNPELPIPLGATPLPNWENEDVEVSADGSTVLIANDVLFVSYVFDTSDPRFPFLAGVIPASDHTLSCVVSSCDWAYGRSGLIVDLRDRSAPIVRGESWFPAIERNDRVHDITRDDIGLLHVDTNPRLILDPRTDPIRPTLVAVGPLTNDVAYQHNGVRPRAAQWTPRAPGDNAPALRPGELVIANGETNFTGTCHEGSGPLATWSIANYDKGAEMKVVDVFRPVSDTNLEAWQNGNPPANAPLGCSGHWFTERGGLVAAAWYEHGTRFFDINQTTGKISQVGFFQPVVGSASAAYWVGDSHVYVVDYERGIDILRFDRSAPPAGAAELAASWRPRPISALAEAERFACRLSMS